MTRVITDAESVEALAAEWPEQRPVRLIERLDDEADLCANEGVDDIAELLSEAATELRALAVRVMELEGALCQISDMTFDSWTNGAIAKEIADAALASKEQP